MYGTARGTLSIRGVRGTGRVSRARRPNMAWKNRMMFNKRDRFVGKDNRFSSSSAVNSESRQ